MKLVLVFVVLIACVLAKNSCTSKDDKKKINSQEDGGAFNNCSVKCLPNDDFASCVSECLQGDALGLSHDCADCWGQEALCTKYHCTIPCLNPKSDACKRCSVSNCGHEFKLCSGLTLKENADEMSNGKKKGGCTSKDDKSKMGNDKGAFKNCSVECLSSDDFASCVSECLQGDALGLSDNCADCWGQEALCTKYHCTLPCLDPGSDACKRCSISSCGHEFKLCSGVTLKDIDDDLEMGKQKKGCTSKDDRTKIDSQEDGGAFRNCGVQCLPSGDFASCVSECLQGDALGLSHDCADCWGQETLCTKYHCAIKCMNPRSDACKRCSISNCGHEFQVCSGVTLTDTADDSMIILE